MEIRIIIQFGSLVFGVLRSIKGEGFGLHGAHTGSHTQRDHQQADSNKVPQMDALDVIQIPDRGHGDAATHFPRHALHSGDGALITRRLQCNDIDAEADPQELQQKEPNRNGYPQIGHGRNVCKESQYQHQQTNDIKPNRLFPDKQSP